MSKNSMLIEHKGWDYGEVRISSTAKDPQDYKYKMRDKGCTVEVRKVK